jgi:hypothetical protein
MNESTDPLPFENYLIAAEPGSFSLQVQRREETGEVVIDASPISHRAIQYKAPQAWVLLALFLVLTLAVTAFAPHTLAGYLVPVLLGTLIVVFFSWPYLAARAAPCIFFATRTLVYGFPGFRSKRSTTDVVAIQLLRVTPISNASRARMGEFQNEINIVLSDPDEPRVHWFCVKKIEEAREHAKAIARALEVPVVEQIAIM